MRVKRSGIVRHDSHMRNSTVDPANNRTLFALWEASSLTATPPLTPENKREIRTSLLIGYCVLRKVPVLTGLAGWLAGAGWQTISDAILLACATGVRGISECFASVISDFSHAEKSGRRLPSAGGFSPSSPVTQPLHSPIHQLNLITPSQSINSSDHNFSTQLTDLVARDSGLVFLQVRCWLKFAQGEACKLRASGKGKSNAYVRFKSNLSSNELAKFPSICRSDCAIPLVQLFKTRLKYVCTRRRIIRGKRIVAGLQESVNCREWPIDTSSFGYVSAAVIAAMALDYSAIARISLVLRCISRSCRISYKHACQSERTTVNVRSQAVACGEALQGKPVLAHYCTSSVHAAGASNHRAAQGKLSVFRPLPRDPLHTYCGVSNYTSIYLDDSSLWRYQLGKMPLYPPVSPRIFPSGTGSQQTFPITKVNQVRLLATSLPDFRTWGSCRMMPLVSGFQRGSPQCKANCTTYGELHLTLLRGELHLTLLRGELHCSTTWRTAPDSTTWRTAPDSTTWRTAPDSTTWRTAPDLLRGELHLTLLRGELHLTLLHGELHLTLLQLHLALLRGELHLTLLRGELHLTLLRGELHLTLLRGELHLALLRGELHLTLLRGELHLALLRGELHLTLLRGELLLALLRGELHLTLLRGELHLTLLRGELHLTLLRGELHLTLLRGELHLTLLRGELHLTLLRGELHLTLLRGELHLTLLRGELHLTLLRGELHLALLRGELHLTLLRRELHLTLLRGELHLTLLRGELHLTLLRGELHLTLLRGELMRN
ncbi:hypothetical protein PR048_024039 [Dryococelus australis]|uniref:Uncharacterized protein n=1 Tax=Dryococelus australis TaxID=614101 RepID=A0ABQ9GVS0_9NEOP|nr:hypothetical protein PR048_024039 [Dryococelus australis]